MSDQRKDGGPASPFTRWINVLGDSPLDPRDQVEGMSKREMFAAHALSGLLARTSESQWVARWQDFEREAFDLADRMLAESARRVERDRRAP